MRKLITVALMSLVLSSCSTLNPLAVLSPKPAVEVNANVGKNVEQEKSTIKLESGTKNVKQEADKIENGKQEADTIKNITQNISDKVLFIIIGLAGLAIDGKGFLVQARKDVVGILKFPFNFILTIFGKDKL